MIIRQTNASNVGINETDNLPGYQHHDALWYDADRHNSYKNLASMIISHYPNIKNILELGSGAGSLAYHIRELNSKLNVVTIDGNMETFNSPYINKDLHAVCRTDVPYELIDIENNSERIIFDLIISFEHLEHIQNDTFDMFLQNIKKHSDKNTEYFMTAANWGAEHGHVHCNIKTKDEWIIYLKNNGFEFNEQMILVDNVEKPFNIIMSMTSELRFKQANITQKT